MSMNSARFCNIAHWLSESPHLTHLKLGYCKMESEILDKIADLLEICPDLAYLQMYTGSGWSESNMIAFLSRIRWSSLRRIEGNLASLEGHKLLYKVGGHLESLCGHVKVDHVRRNATLADLAAWNNTAYANMLRASLEHWNGILDPYWRAVGAFWSEMCVVPVDHVISNLPCYPTLLLESCNGFPENSSTGQTLVRLGICLVGECHRRRLGTHERENKFALPSTSFAQFQAPSAFPPLPSVLRARFPYCISTDWSITCSYRAWRGQTDKWEVGIERIGRRNPLVMFSLPCFHSYNKRVAFTSSLSRERLTLTSCYNWQEWKKWIVKLGGGTILGKCLMEAWAAQPNQLYYSSPEYESSTLQVP